MRQRLHEARRRESGFTLIELLIVIVILGVLAAVVILAVGAFNERGEVAACKSDVKAVEVAVEAFRAKEGHYPDNLGVLDDPPGNYLRTLPNDEESGEGEYYITYDSTTGAVDGIIRETGKSCIAPTTGEPTAPGGGEPGGGEPGGGESPSPSPSPSTSSSPPATAPSTPTNVNVGSCGGSGQNNRTCTATWSASTGNPTPQYEWQRVRRDGGSCSSNDFNQSGVVGSTTSATSVQLTNLTNNQNYCFRVRATNSAGQSNWAYDEFQP